MKRLLFALCLCVGLQTSAWSQFYVDGINVQELDIEYLGVNVHGQSLLSKYTRVIIDYGQNPAFKKQDFMGPNRREIQFHSEMDVLNFLYKLGWELDHVYQADLDDGPTNFILRRKKE